MPLTESKLRGLLSKLVPDIDDEAVLGYLVTSLLEADGLDEIREVCEPWLGAATDAAVEALSDELAPSAKPEARTAATSGVVSRLSPAAAAAFAPPARGCAEQGAEEAVESDTKDDAAVGKRAKPKAKTKTASRVQKKSGATATRAQACDSQGTRVGDLVEVTAQVSRFHKEAVQNEVTSVLDIDVHGICMSVAGKELLVDAHLKLCPGERYGFIGRNGSGKSSLLRAMEAKRIPGFPEQCTALLVAQEDVGDDRSAVDAVLSAHEELAALLAQERSLQPCEGGDAKAATMALRAADLAVKQEERRRAAHYESKLSGQRGRDARKALLEAEAREQEAEAAMGSAAVDEDAPVLAAERLAEVRDRLGVLDPSVLRVQAMSLLRGLGFGQGDLEVPTRQLSGGWRMRVAIARALFARPTVLMLDEPTNHLDWSAVLWLERYLQSAEMEDVALVVVSHDRAFLDNVCTTILRLHDKQLHLHSGNYSTFEQAHEDDQQHRAELAQRVQEKRDKVEKQVQQMEQKGRKTNNENLLKAVASRKTKLGLDGRPWSFNRVGLEGAGGHKFKASYGTNVAAEAAMATESKEAEVKLRLKAAVPLGFEAALLQCRSSAVGHSGAGDPLIRAFDLDVRAKARIALLGVNGSGKTTLLRTLAGDLPAVAGEVYRQPRVVVGFFNQHQAEALPADASAVEALLERCPGHTEADARAHLGSFGLGRQAVQPIGTLSGGEKCRVALAAITLRAPHVLLLDEPTNHLDLPTVEALGHALRDFEGSVVLCSHDRRLLQDVCSDFYAVQARKLVRLGCLDDFVRAVRAGKAQ